jgi:hypothetical protein
MPEYAQREWCLQYDNQCNPPLMQAHRSSVSATKQLWFDGDRPTTYEWGVTNNVCLS